VIGSVRGGLGSVRTAQNGDTVPAGAGGPWPGFGVTAPPAVASTSSLGSSGLGAQSDHTHAGVTSVNGLQGAVTLTGFPGYGGAPGAVASTSFAGAATTVSRSDHTHALNIVAYNPSLAGMQAGGVIQQTYSAPTATPAVLTMTTGNIPFGAPSSTGVLTQNQALFYDGTNRRLFLQGNNAAPVADANTIGQLNLISNSVVASLVIGFHGSSTLAPITRTYRSRGTQAAPTAVGANDPVITHQLFAHDGVTGYNTVLTYGTGVPFGATVSSGSVPVSFYVAPGAATTENAWTLFAHNNKDAGGGDPALTTTSVTGWWWVPGTAGPPTATPTLTFGGNVSRNRSPIQTDVTNQRLYSYVGGGWHFATLNDYDPTATRIPFGGGTAHTLTDNANLTYSGFNIQLGSTAAQQELVQTGNQSLFVGTGSGNTTGTLYLGTAHAARVSIDGTGVVTTAGSGAAAPGGTYGNMVWNPALARLTFGAAGAPPAVGSIQMHSSTSSGISIGGGITATVVISDSGGGSEASIAVDSRFYGQGLVGWQASGLADLYLVASPGNFFFLKYAGDRIGSGTDAITMDGTTGALAISTDVAVSDTAFSVTASTSIVLSSLGGSIVIAGDVLVNDPTSSTAIHVTSAGVSVQTPLSVQSTITLSQTTAAGAQALTIGNGPTATGGGAADIYFTVKSGANTYVVPAWQI
jgi:hypothetical protein